MQLVKDFEVEKFSWIGQVGSKWNPELGGIVKTEKKARWPVTEDVTLLTLQIKEGVMGQGI